MAIHNEIKFEDEICDYLSSGGWKYAQDDADKYDRELALFPEDVLQWVKGSSPDAWEALEKNHGASAEQTLIKRLRDCLNQGGALEVLRNGFDVLGLRSKLKMAQFKPALPTEEIVERYEQNILRVVRQVHYSVHNELNIDLVLFLNGIPVATVELKTDFTQSIDDAVDQYRFDRLPTQKGKGPEPLLQFASGALVHFAVSSSEVMMTTKLAGPATVFLPFNQGSNGPGNDGSKGNPHNPEGHKTSYLWEKVWQRDSWLDILGRYMLAERDSKKNIKTIVFPRFHQLDVTRDLVSTVLDEGPGRKYLVQHSAGSGKTKSIAWTAHFLADLHEPKTGEKVFQSVIVVSDRNVIDGQLQDAIFEMERNKGVVATIKGSSGSKSGELAEALAGNKKIVVCTIQTFPFAMEEVSRLSATEGKKFAVIADEAHSSQTGRAATKLKQMLTVEEQEDLEDGGTISTEDLLAVQMSSRASDAGVTYVAFTATPKEKTLENFGRLPDPTKPRGKDNLPEPFHVYSMQQAIEEGFILDVLKNYTSYKLAFRLANDGKEWTDDEVETSEAKAGLMRWVRLHPYNIAQKVQIVVEHFREQVAPLLEGRAKAMVVTSSRKEAVRWQVAINKYIKDSGYPLKTLVAFSGEVNDKESGPEPFKETSSDLNPDLKGRDIREAFKGDEYQILLVANKFQTGFDQPLLCGMYVDKKLKGIHTVQTLSRLNRCYPGKEDTYVLDFVNEPADVLLEFKKYFTTASLEDVTDRNIVLDLRTKLDQTGHYDEPEIERVVAIELNPNSKQKQLEAAIAPVADRLLKKFESAKAALKEAKDNEDKKAESEAKDEMNALLLFKADLSTYQRAYTFLSQIFDYANTDLEKRSIFYRYLIPLLKFGRERQGVDLSQVKLTHYKLRNRGKQPMPLKDKEYPTIPPITAAGTGSVREEKKAYLSEIIEQLNELFEGDLTDDDKLIYVNNVIKGKLLESDTLRQQAKSNSKEQFANSPDLSSEIMNAIMAALDAHTEMSSQALASEQVRDGIKQVLMGPSKLYEALRDEEQVD
ncbi:MAG: type I restriction endonuclease subunit R [Aureliella sp.]